MTKWEYLVVFLGDGYLYMMNDGEYGSINELGIMGWEIVAIVPSKKWDKGYFKRPIPENMT